MSLQVVETKRVRLVATPWDFVTTILRPITAFLSQEQIIPPNSSLVTREHPCNILEVPLQVSKCLHQCLAAGFKSFCITQPNS